MPKKQTKRKPQAVPADKTPANKTPADKTPADETPADEKSYLTLPLLSLRDLVIFPQMMMPLFVGRDKSIQALQAAMDDQRDIILAAQKDARRSNPGPDDIHTVGTLCTIIQHLRLPDGTVKALVEGKGRVHIKKYLGLEPYFKIQVLPIVENTKKPTEAKALARMVCSTFETYVKLNRQIPPEVLARVATIDNFNELADNIASQMTLKLEDQQAILESFNAVDRLRMILKHITREIEVLKVEKKLRSNVKEQMERTHKEYYLNEQLQAIQKELGEKDDFQKEVKELEEKARKKKWSKEAQEKATREIKKLKIMSPMSAETGIIRNYIDWMIDLPWAHYIKEKCHIKKAQDVLNKDHWGLKQVKERILEYLAVRTMTDQPKSPILCFVGPPGVGKTSLARSIARALGRPFASISMGGVQDEAEIRGHRRTYVGAMPGKIIQALRKVKYGNPLFLLDEVDKISTNFRGDPSSALLEVLDPEQNEAFQDHYLEVNYDLSSILFITTANSAHNIPRALLDRMEKIPIEGYTEAEKLDIADKYLVCKQIKKHGLEKYSINFSKDILKTIIRYYTREAGVRELERQIAKICRKLVRDIISAKEEGKKAYDCTITHPKIKHYLGIQKFKYGKAEKRSEIGLTNGLAWTETGGDLLIIEAIAVPGKGKFIITGQLGDVMKESCSAALSYVRSRGPLFGLPPEFFEKHDFHIHVPEGAVPKDGPSAGVAITTSLVSAITRFPVRKTIAMTGEITLRGRVLAIGGLKEKILAAHREGIKTIIIPQENAKDLKDKEKDLPADILKKLEIITVQHIDQILVKALEIKVAQDLFKRRFEKISGLKAHYSQNVSLQKH